MPIRNLFVAAENENKNKNRNTIIYRATLDFDGVFRLYSHDMANKVISIVKTWPDNACSVKGFCGFNSYCALADENPFCYCLPGFDYLDPNQNTLGCKRNSSEDKCSEEEFYRMVSLDKLAWDGDRSYFQAQMADEEHCSSSCLKDCNCWAASYDQSTKIYMKQQTPLRYARRVQLNEKVPSLKFFKVGNLNLNHVSSEPVPETPLSHKIIKTTSNKAILRIILVTSIFTLIFCSTIGISCHLMSKIRVLKYKRLLEIGDLGLNEEVALRRFSYTELKRATNGFKQELGKGSFGAVYKGVLYKAGRCRRFIAVKRLEKLVEDGEREFQAEVRAIGKTHHRNLVRLLGFCAEGPKRLLVYEYMSNGSLGKLLFGDERLPDWDERVRIALDIARGILYLHEECEAPIIHCDIKPQNILMDEFWTAKISDFGLAKLLMPDQTRTFTGVRGTRGYLAPEWNKNTPITVKADIYSYGIVLLETVCCRRNLDANVSEPNEILLSGWAYKCFVAGEVHKLVHWEEVDKNVVENTVKVALWCIQDEPVLRPSMKSVVLMLEGVTHVPMPPCPTSNSM
ncbi:G-type lectin S-receptor-like serine/threonine-protein kinase LECRK1 [Arachis ipaensis]|uniref:G-type lectin S-receptor-like serine/threonine-protein kinase LECRK1 n=1 Tax=Arachis ipaensis TaxID=130454 RepID=UPI000A2B237D|nr:G-type lectin S-receptor-like serine/threonine-protein kinase LECRK1 [Arachis ipaensis]